MSDKGSGMSGFGRSKVGSKVDVPYGNPYTPEKQTQMVKERVASGLRELMDLVRSGAEACVDRAAIIEQATKLERQAEKIYDAIEKDNVYIEEVRHHHNRISDLCDNTRNYTQSQMVADLKRAAAIRVNVMTIIQGKAPEYEMEQDELDDLKTVRNMLRRKFGGRKTKKTGMEEQIGDVDQSAMLGDPSSVKVSGNATGPQETGLFADDNELGGFLKAGAGWASDVLGEQATKK